ncbi:MAG: hypothetical protein ABID84_04760 [Chloroflexota bacterium]
MSYCPEHGLEMTRVAESPGIMVYLCPESSEVWVYNGDLGSYYCQDSLLAGDCPNCDRKAQPLVCCDGCRENLCPYCWAEHEFDARCVSDPA